MSSRSLSDPQATDSHRSGQRSLDAFGGSDPGQPPTESRVIDRPNGRYQPPVGKSVAMIVPGDVLGFRSEPGLTAHVEPTTSSTPESGDTDSMVRLRFLEASIPPLTIDQDYLSELCAVGFVDLVTTGVTDPRDRWAIEPEYPPDSDPSVRTLSALHHEVAVRPRQPTDRLSWHRERSHNLVNGLLTHPFVRHSRGEIQFSRAIFSARRDDGALCAAGVLNRPRARAAADGVTVELTRFASHEFCWGRTYQPPHTNNTGSWLLAKALTWAELEGFERVISFSGTDDNTGGLYQSLGFDLADYSRSDGQWADAARPDRETISHDHDRLRLWEYACYDDSPAIPRRAYAREYLHRDQAQTGLPEGGTGRASDPTSLPPSAPDQDDYYLLREDTHEQSTNPHQYDPRVDGFLEEWAPESVTPATLAAASRGGKSPAIFGLGVQDHLVGLCAVAGDPNGQSSTAEVIAYVDAGTKYPQRTAQDVFARIRRWVALEGYDRLVADIDTVAAVESRTDASSILTAGDFAATPSGWTASPLSP